MNASEISKLSLDELKELKSQIDQALETRILETQREVKVTGVKEGTWRLELKGKTYEAQMYGVRQRLRVYRLEKGARPGTLRRGQVIDREFIGGVWGLRSAIAFGYIG